MKYLFSLIALICFHGSLKAQTTLAERKAIFNIDKYGVAIQGYDPVSYFEGKAQKGSSSIYHFHKGIRYEFVSEKHKETFKASPDKYEPQYGGWCAYAMGANGEKVEIDPTKFKVLDGKLYLFYYSIINNTLNKWNLYEASLKAKADINWKKLNQSK